MIWLKAAAKTVFLIVPITFALFWLVRHLVVPIFGTESFLLALVASWLALLIANWIWPPD
jgi:hypothetical protein